MECEKHETVVNNITENKNCLIKMNESLKSNWEVTKEVKIELKEVQKTHAILMTLQSDITTIKEQIREFSEVNKLNVKDYAMQKIIDLLIYGSLGGLLYINMR